MDGTVSFRTRSTGRRRPAGRRGRAGCGCRRGRRLWGSRRGSLKWSRRHRRQVVRRWRRRDRRRRHGLGGAPTRSASATRGPGVSASSSSAPAASARSSGRHRQRRRVTVGTGTSIALPACTNSARRRIPPPRRRRRPVFPTGSRPQTSDRQSAPTTPTARSEFRPPSVGRGVALLRCRHLRQVGRRQRRRGRLVRVVVLRRGRAPRDRGLRGRPPCPASLPRRST